MKTEGKNGLVWVMVLYLLGLFIGALNMGIITPVRPIIQTSLNVDSSTGIWMVNIYTLCYAAIIPIAGKFADRIGRKSVYFASILLFGIGSVFCGLSESVGSFAVLMVGRVAQAAGAGGIMPIATAEFGTSFPPEKRGMALGMVGAVYGIGSVLGATVGSAVLDIFGVANWQWLFYSNVIFCVLILIGTAVFIPNHKGEIIGKIDKLGTLVMTLMILFLLYGLKNFNFFDFLPSLTSVGVYPYLIAFVILLPIFYLIERKAEDPIFHMEYLKNRAIMVTLVMGLLVGASMMGMVFIPQFAENAMRIPSGSGGYFVLILGVFAVIASPVSGSIIDRFGVKPVMGAGFIISILGSLYLAFIATVYVNWINVVVSLILIGIGLGLVMGTPLNYMMLDHTKEEESNSALATLSLIRSVGTAVAPAIMVGFIIQSAVGIDTKLMEQLPPLPDASVMRQTEELSDIMDTLSRDNEDVKEMAKEMNLDQMLSMPSMSFDDMGGDSDFTLPADLLDEFQNADVTTITNCVMDMTRWMFEENTPAVIADIQGGINEGRNGLGEGIDGIDSGIHKMNGSISEMKMAMAKLQSGINGISSGINGMEQGLSQQDKAIKGLTAAIAAAESGDFNGMPAGMGGSSPTGGTPVGNGGSDAPQSGSDETAGGEDPAGDSANTGETGGEANDGNMPSGSETPAMNLEAMKAQLVSLTAARDTLQKKYDEALTSRSKMQTAWSKMQKGLDGMNSGLNEMKEQKAMMDRADTLMGEIHDEIPVIFNTMETDYVTFIKEHHNDFETCFQKAMNKGYRDMFIFVAVLNVLGFALLPFYPEESRRKKRQLSE